MNKAIVIIGLAISALAEIIFVLKTTRKPHGKSMTIREIYEDNFGEKWSI